MFRAQTRSAQTAKLRVTVAAAKLGEYWSHLRMNDPDLIGSSLLKSGYTSFAVPIDLLQYCNFGLESKKVELGLGGKNEKFNN